MQKLRRDFSRYERSIRTEKTGRRGDSESGRAYMQNAVSDGQDGARTAVQMLRRLEDQHGEKQAEQLLQTAQVYYEYGGSVAKAAEKLNLHKNTLLYRMKQLYQTLELEQDTVFVREFFIRMLLEYRNMPEDSKSPEGME